MNSGWAHLTSGQGCGLVRMYMIVYVCGFVLEKGENLIYYCSLMAPAKSRSTSYISQQNYYCLLLLLFKVFWSLLSNFIHVKWFQWWRQFFWYLYWHPDDILCPMASVIKCHIWHLIYELLLAAFDPFDNILGGGGWMRENQDKDHFSPIWIWNQ